MIDVSQQTSLCQKKKKKKRNDYLVSQEIVKESWESTTMVNSGPFVLTDLTACP